MSKPKWIVSSVMFETEGQALALMAEIGRQGGVGVLCSGGVCESTKDIDGESWKGAFVYGSYQFYRAIYKRLEGDVALPIDVKKLKYSATIEQFPSRYVFNKTRLYTTWQRFVDGDIDYLKTKGVFAYLHGPGQKPKYDEWAGRPVFVRSDSVTKTVPGQVIKPCEYDFRAIDDVTSVMPDTEIVLAPEAILPPFEERLVVIDDKIVGRSVYLENGDVEIHEPMDETPYKAGMFVDTLKEHMDGMPYTLDIARWDRDVCRIVEVNSLNCAGWYACRLSGIVRAVHGAMDKQG